MFDLLKKLLAPTQAEKTQPTSQDVKSETGNKDEIGITLAPYRDRVDPKVSDETTSSSAQSLSLDGLRDLSALSKLQVRECKSPVGEEKLQKASSSMNQLAAAGAKALNYIMEGDK